MKSRTYSRTELPCYSELRSNRASKANPYSPTSRSSSRRTAHRGARAVLVVAVEVALGPLQKTRPPPISSHVGVTALMDSLHFPPSLIPSCQVVLRSVPSKSGKGLSMVFLSNSSCCATVIHNIYSLLLITLLICWNAVVKEEKLQTNYHFHINREIFCYEHFSFLHLLFFDSYFFLFNAFLFSMYWNWPKPFYSTPLVKFATFWMILF